MLQHRWGQGGVGGRIRLRRKKVSPLIFYREYGPAPEVGGCAIIFKTLPQNVITRGSTVY